jgi:hypothetical protein
MPMQVGQRMYFLARPYILTPDLRLTVGIPHPSADPSERRPGQIGEVIASEWVGMRHTEIGHAQAWGYPADGATSSTGTGAMIPRSTRASSSCGAASSGRSWADIYDVDRWQDFLRSLGYVSFTNRAFVKELGQ